MLGDIPALYGPIRQQLHQQPEAPFGPHLFAKARAEMR
jgi:hypothetical protein